MIGPGRNAFRLIELGRVGALRGRVRAARTAFTLIELLVVVAIIVILLGAVITVSTSVLGSAKARDTEALLKTLDLAIDQFHSDAPLAKVKGYADRYNNYPPDELEVFSAADGIPGGGGNLAGTSAQLEDDNGAQLALTASAEVTKHRDVKAMVLAIKLYSSGGAAILEQIDKRFVRVGQTVEGGRTEYFDRDQAGNNDAFREPLIYFVDAWGVPIEYYAATLCTTCTPSDDCVATDKFPVYPTDGARVTASTAFVRANNGVPMLVSYGPDGKDQFDDNMIKAEGATELVWDFNSDYAAAGAVNRQINHRFNRDNVYSNAALADKFAAKDGLP